MNLRDFISKTVRNFLNEQNILKENINNVDRILDKINKYGQNSLTFDERTYLKQYSDNSVDADLENWLFSDKDETFDSEGNKLLYDEFEFDEDILYNHNKFKTVIAKHLNKQPFTNNADWGDGYVWKIKAIDDFIGTFLYLGDDELVVLKRTLVDDRYKDEVIEHITTSRELYKFFMSLKKNYPLK